MLKLTFNDHDEHVVTLALELARDHYHWHAAKLAAENTRLADQFTRQAADAQRQIDRFNQAGD